MNWKNLYRGFMMGISDVIPGVSGGTIAVLLGIYDDFIASIDGIFTRHWKKHLSFLIPLLLGMGIALLAFSHIIKWLFATYPEPTQFFFLGLIIGILPYLFRQTNEIGTFKIHHIILLIIGATLCASLVFLDTASSAVIVEFNIKTYLFLFLAGMLASAAMILPGISGSFVLLVLGAYHTIIEALSTLQLQVLIVVALGIAFGMIFMSKLIHYFMKHFKLATFSVVIGLVIGSIFVVFPGWPTGMQIVYSLVTAMLGLFCAYILGKVEY